MTKINYTEDFTNKNKWKDSAANLIPCEKKNTQSYRTNLSFVMKYFRHEKIDEFKPNMLNFLLK